MSSYIPIFPEAIDNSMRKDWVKCDTAAHFKHELGLHPVNEVREDLIAGGAYAKGMEVMRRRYFVEGKSPEQALNDGVTACYAAYGNFQPSAKSNKTADKMAGALAYYAAEFPLADERFVPMMLGDELAVELCVAYPTGIAHPVTGKDIPYVFNFDCLTLDADDGKSVWVMDEKTTSQMGEKWANQWFMDGQFSGYCWAAKRLIAEAGLDLEVKGAVINGIAIRLRDYECRRLNVYRQDWEIDRWWAQVTRDIINWKARFEQQNHGHILDHNCANYLNPCEFMPLCLSRNPERLFHGSYVQRFWNPMKKGE